MSALEVIIYGLQNMRVSRIDGSEYYCGQQVAVSTQQAAAKELLDLRTENERLQKAVKEAERIIAPIAGVRSIGLEEAIILNALLDAGVRWLMEYRNDAK